jgi:hypothetical protein
MNDKKIDEPNFKSVIAELKRLDVPVPDIKVKP